VGIRPGQRPRPSFGHPQGSIHKVHIAASKIFTAALAAQTIAVNPARDVQLPRVPDIEARFLTLDEIAVRLLVYRRETL
jgi:hypothetical protein